MNGFGLWIGLVRVRAMVRCSVVIGGVQADPYKYAQLERIAMLAISRYGVWSELNG